MDPSACGTRRARVQEWMRERELALLLVTAGPNLAYLAGWSSPYALERLTALLLPARGEPVLLVPALDREAAAAAGLPVEAWWDGEDPYARLAALARSLGAAGGRWAVERERLTLAAADRIARSLAEPVEWVGADAVLAAMRRVKDAAELAALERAAAVVDAALARWREALRPGVSERWLAARLREALLEAGADGVAFDPLVLSGPNSALPHGQPGGRRVEPGDLVLVDCGAVVDGYCSDITRVFAVGGLSPEAARVYGVVAAALAAGIAAVRPGALPGEVDAAARRVIEEAGYGPHFPHRAGHGLGLEVHEAPWLHAGDPEPLQPGTVLTVEPGVYLPGRFGVRLEQMVVVTGEGARVLTGFPLEGEEMQVAG